VFNLDTSMNINFEDHILDLLKHNDCVVLPNFGGFILKSIPSTIHQHTISPPSKQIAFNSSLKHDDELLTGAIMGKHSLPYETAKNKVLAFSNQISFGIKKDASFKLNKIGSFSVNENNQIIFKPFVLELSDSSFYGMRKFHLKPIPKQLIKPSVKKIEKEVVQVRKERQNKVRKTSNRAIVGLFSSILLLAGVIGLMGSNTQLAPAKTQQAGFVELLFPNDSFVESFKNTVVYNEPHVNYPVSQKEGYINETLIRINQRTLAKGYYIVLGSYASLKNAERMEAQLFAKGNDSYIFPSDNGFYRVGIYADANLIASKSILAEQHLENVGAWLIKN